MARDIDPEPAGREPAGTLPSASAVDAAWRGALLRSMRDGVVIFDSEGQVLELNQAFANLSGYGLADGPLRPPYPWWPTAEEDAAGLADIQRVHARVLGGEDVDSELVLYRRDRRPLRVWSRETIVRHDASGLAARVQTVRDITRSREARARRAAAAEVSADFSCVDDLATLIGVAAHGFNLLFEGDSTIQLTVDGQSLFFGFGRSLADHELSSAVQTGLAGERNPDTTSLRPGILLTPPSATHACRAWIQFPRPRRIGPDEMIVADLLATAFALALERVSSALRAANREASLEQALDSHRLIGQATGILVERHRLVPNEAFERLKRASQRRNLKLREIATRVIETGAEPEDA